jgi:pyridoxine 5-phosphate synthase
MPIRQAYLDSKKSPRLGVNIDHIATLRQLRGTPYPDLLQAARLIESAGAHQITAHLREDRRHIQDEDIKMLRSKLRVPLNLEMSLAEEMVRFACKIKPNWVCLVPEKREELTTEGGLDVKANESRIAEVISRLKDKKIKVSLFIEPSLSVVKLSHALGANAVEFHTGSYCLATQGRLGKRSAEIKASQMKKLKEAGVLAFELGVTPHAGHGLDTKNIRPLLKLKNLRKEPLFEEYNIGHFLVCRSAFVGLEAAVEEMLHCLSQ